MRLTLKLVSTVMCFVFYLTNSQAFASEFILFIKDSNSEFPIKEAIVTLPNQTQFFSDNAGKVVVKNVTRPVILQISHDGYLTVEETIQSNTDPITIFLSKDTVELDTIVISSETTQEAISQVTLPIEELSRAPGSQGDPLKVIESLPGIAISQSFGGGPVGGFYVRGSDQNENIAWVDGSTIGYLYHFGGLYSTLNPALISDFKIYLGGFPVEYGDVLGGALDVSLRSPRRDRLHQKYSIGTYQSSFFLEGPIGKKNSEHGFFLAARRSYIDLIFSPEKLTSIFQSDEDKNKPEEEKNKIISVPVFYDLQAVWEYNSEFGDFWFRYFGAADEARLLFNENRKSDPEAAGERSFETNFNTYSFNWENEWNAYISHTAPLTIYDTLTRFKIGTDQTTGKPFFLDIKNKQVNWQPELRYITKMDNQFNIGTFFAYSETPIDANITREPNEGDIGDINFTDRKKFKINQKFKAGSLSPYINYLHDWSGNFSTNIGLRYNYTKISGGAKFTTLLPRFNFEYNFITNYWLTGAWGRYVQLPKGSEIAEGVGNPNLDYTKAEHRILGIKHRYDIWTIQLEAFHKPMTSLVVPIDENDPPDNYRNAGEGEAYGIDLLIKRDFTQDRTGWLSYSYIKTTRTGLDGITRPFSSDQPHSLTLLWTQGLLGSWNKWDIGFRFRFHSGQPYDRVIGRETLPDGRILPVYSNKKNADRLPNFYQLDFRIDRHFKFNNWKMSVYLDILNILNNSNVSGYDYGDNYEKIDNPDEESGIPLFPTFGIEAEF